MPRPDPDLIALGKATRAAFREICATYQKTGLYPRTQSAARAIARRHKARPGDVLMLAGFRNIDASPPAIRLYEKLHGARKK